MNIYQQLALSVVASVIAALIVRRLANPRTNQPTPAGVMA